MFSYWESEVFLSKADVTVIGSGIVGLAASIELAERFPTKRVVVLERGSLPKGASTKNAGFACFGSMTELMDDLVHASEAEVFEVVRRRWNGLKKLRNTVGNDRMDFSLTGGYELFLSADEQLFESTIAELSRINLLLHEVTGEKSGLQARALPDLM